MKKIYILIGCMMLSIMTLGLHVNASAFKTTISIDQITAGDENYVEVPVRIINNKGLLGITITINYDQALVLTDVNVGTALSSLTMTKPGDLNEKRIKILWDGIEADSSNGIVATLIFNKPSKAGTYNIDISYENGDIIDGSLQPVEADMINGSILVNESSGGNEGVCIHSGGEATCVKKAICNVCKKEYGEKNPNNHVGSTEIRNYKKATCEEDGYTGDTYCKDCNNMIKEGLKIKATGHTPVTDPAVPATATTPGKTEGKHCSVCGTVIVAQQTIPATGQKEEKPVQKPAETPSQEPAALTPYIKLSATTLPLQLKKSTTALKVVDMLKGDGIASFTSSNPKVVAVNASTGKLTGKKVGKAVITVTLRSGVKATCTVKVQKNKVTTKSIKIGTKKLTLKRGAKTTIPIEVNPLTSADKVKVTSSNKKVATVTNKGVVKAKKKGTAKITIQSGKKKVVCKVTVK